LEIRNSELSGNGLNRKNSVISPSKNNNASLGDKYCLSDKVCVDNNLQIKKGEQTNINRESYDNAMPCKLTEIISSLSQDLPLQRSSVGEYDNTGRISMAASKSNVILSSLPPKYTDTENVGKCKVCRHDEINKLLESGNSCNSQLINQIDQRKNINQKDKYLPTSHSTARTHYLSTSEARNIDCVMDLNVSSQETSLVATSNLFSNKDCGFSIGECSELKCDRNVGEKCPHDENAQMDTSLWLSCEKHSREVREKKCPKNNECAMHSVRETFQINDKDRYAASNNIPLSEKRDASIKDERFARDNGPVKLTKVFQENRAAWESPLLLNKGALQDESFENHKKDSMPLRLTLDLSAAKSPESFAKALRDGLDMLNDEFNSSGGKLDKLKMIEIGFLDGSIARFASNEEPNTKPIYKKSNEQSLVRRNVLSNRDEVLTRGKEVKSSLIPSAQNDLYTNIHIQSELDASPASVANSSKNRSFGSGRFHFPDSKSSMNISDSHSDFVVENNLDTSTAPDDTRIIPSINVKYTNSKGAHDKTLPQEARSLKSNVKEGPPKDQKSCEGQVITNLVQHNQHGNSDDKSKKEKYKEQILNLLQTWESKKKARWNVLHEVKSKKISPERTKESVSKSSQMTSLTDQNIYTPSKETCNMLKNDRSLNKKASSRQNDVCTIDETEAFVIQMLESCSSSEKARIKNNVI